MSTQRARSIPAELLSRCDPGWLFLLTGIALIAAVVILPARDDLDQAEWMRDQILAEEAYRGEQLARHSNLLQSLRAEDPKVVRWLAASQLNMAIEGHDVLPAAAMPRGTRREADVFEMLNPVYDAPASPSPPDSLLHRLAVDERARLWVVLGGAMCIFYGLLPAAAARTRPVGAPEDRVTEDDWEGAEWDEEEIDNDADVEWAGEDDAAADAEWDDAEADAESPVDVETEVVEVDEESDVDDEEEWEWVEEGDADAEAEAEEEWDEEAEDDHEVDAAADDSDEVEVEDDDGEWSDKTLFG